MTNWHDTPPTKAGRYYVKRWNGQEMTAKVYEENGKLVFESDCGSRCLCEKGLEEHYKFGNRLPTNDELAELPGLLEEYAEHRESSVLARIREILGGGVADDAGAD